ncbi:MAG: adenylyltransferase/cytidyltransferase family protein [Gammaproteobacteria bacterium]|nr:adenylyltransferase/cytidyltransferase family protein [Gammaproteobacteria bacterium]
MSREKIHSLDALGVIAQQSAAQGKRIVLCHGCFDLLHIGHIRYLEKARERGDLLFVTVTADEYVNKGPGRPVFPAELRAEHLASLAMVDGVAVNHAITAINVIEKIKPRYYVKGGEYQDEKDDVTGNIARERQEAEKWGGELSYTDEVTFSSSRLLNENFCMFSPETERYLQNFRQKYNSRGIIKQLEKFSNLRVAVVGDAIIDEYQYTDPLGQTGKGNVLAVKYQSAEKFAGGAIAVANHAANFVGEVTLFTGLGSYNSDEEFIREKLAKNVTPKFVYFSDAPTILKRRYVDPDAAKLFEVYFYEEEACDAKLEREACAWINAELNKFDVVIVPDFGNGFISSEMVAALCKEARFLAVNTQINSGNRGYHVINQYPRADFISLNEPEMRLASHDRHSPLFDVAEAVGKNLGASYVAVTRGTNGAMMIAMQDKGYYEVPALSTKVLDRIGAGDTFLSLAGICTGGGMPAEAALFVASAAAALDVQIMCNREPVDAVSLFKYINTLLK